MHERQTVLETLVPAMAGFVSAVGGAIDEQSVVRLVTLNNLFFYPAFVLAKVG